MQPGVNKPEPKAVHPGLPLPRRCGALWHATAAGWADVTPPSLGQGWFIHAIQGFGASNVRALAARETDAVTIHWDGTSLAVSPAFDPTCDGRQDLAQPALTPTGDVFLMGSYDRPNVCAWHNGTRVLNTPPPTLVGLVGMGAASDGAVWVAGATGQMFLASPAGIT